MKIATVLFAFTILIRCASAGDFPVGNPAAHTVLSHTRLLLLREAVSYLHTPYASPPNVPRSFDCSGFVSHIYGKFGHSLPRTSRAYTNVGTVVAWQDALPGDILIFTRTKGSATVSHVAILYQRNASGSLAGSWIIHSASRNTGRSLIYGNPTTRTGVVITELGLRADGIPANEYFYQRFKHTVRVLRD